jgi:Domain of unknown function (DUF4331)
MRTYALAALGIATVAVLAVLVGPTLAGEGTASSHREAPLIAEDPSGDNTDLYAFRSPDKPSTLTIVSNWIPGEDPAAGPNWYTFSPSARYNVKIDRTGDGRADITYAFRFKTATGPLFLGNTTQSFTVTRNGRAYAKGTTPPNNIGPRLLGFLGIKNYKAAVAKSIVSAPGGVKVFAGQRDDAFYGDIGAIFDLLGFRKAGTTGNKGGGKDFFAGYNVHAVALQIPISQLDNARHTIGIWSSTDRRNVTVGGKLNRGWTQVSRLGNPLINEVIIPTSLKDAWNRGEPAQDAKYLKYYSEQLLAATINTVYKLGVPATKRDDLVAVLLTGIPNVTFTGARLADMLRINLAVPVTPAGKVSRMGVLGGDNGGWPNGRRLGDDVIDIAEQAVAGFLKGTKLPLGDGVNSGDVANLRAFPYEAHPAEGYANSKGQQKP